MVRWVGRVYVCVYLFESALSRTTPAAAAAATAIVAPPTIPIPIRPSVCVREIERVSKQECHKSRHPKKATAQKTVGNCDLS